MSRRVALGCIVVLLLGGPSFAQPIAGGARTVDYPIDGVTLGNGWFSSAGSKAPGRCILFETRADDAQDQSMRFIQVRDKDSLMQSLEVSAEFQAKALFASASGKAEFAKRLEIRNDLLSISVQATVRQGASFVDAPKNGGFVRLAPQMLKLIKQRPEDFYRTCGDSFVAAIHSGAQLSALLTFLTTSRDEQQTIRANVTGSYSGLNATASMSSTLKQYSEHSRLEIVYHLAGGSGTPFPVSETELFERIRSLPEAASKAAQKWRLTLQRYDSLPEWPLSRGDWKLSEIEEAARQYYRLATLYYNVSTIIQNNPDYVLGFGSSLESVKRVQDDLRRHMDSLIRGLRQCMFEQQAHCAVDATDLISDYEIRYKLPVKADSFELSTTLAKERERAASLSRSMDSLPDTIDVPVPVPAAHVIRIPNAQKQAMRAQLENARASVGSLEARYPDALRAAIFEQWIDRPSLDRCLLEPTGPLCLSQALLDDYRAKINAFVVGSS